MASATAPPPFIVGVAGGAASGKTAVCEEIMRQLGQAELAEHKRQVVIVNMDSFYKELTPEDQVLANTGDYNYDHPDAFDFDLLESTLSTILAGKDVRVRRYDGSHGAVQREFYIVHRPDVVLLEGIHVLFDKRVRQLLSLAIFVDEDSDTRLARRTLRDVQERKRDIDTILRQYVNFVKPAFEDYIFPSKRHADIIIPRGRENQVAIDLIIRHIKDILVQRKDTRRTSTADALISPELKSNLPQPSPQLRPMYRELDN